jgi:hypothetical protein
VAGRGRRFFRTSEIAEEHRISVLAGWRTGDMADRPPLFSADLRRMRLATKGDTSSQSTSR